MSLPHAIAKRPCISTSRCRSKLLRMRLSHSELDRRRSEDRGFNLLTLMTSKRAIEADLRKRVIPCKITMFKLQTKVRFCRRVARSLATLRRLSSSCLIRRQMARVARPTMKRKSQGNCVENQWVSSTRLKAKSLSQMMTLPSRLTNTSQCASTKSPRKNKKATNRTRSLTTRAQRCLTRT